MPRPKTQSPRPKLTTTISKESMRTLDLFGLGNRGLTIDWLIRNVSDEGKKKIEELEKKFILS